MQFYFIAGKTSVASSLASHYDIPILKLDDIIVASFSSGTTYGNQARELCAEAAQRIAEEKRAYDDPVLMSQRGPAGAALSTAAVTAYSQGTMMPLNAGTVKNMIGVNCTPT